MGERARILIVDDDESIRKVVATILREKGYAVDTAETGKEAIAKSNRKFFNLALIDMRLPDMEGTQLLTLMRETTPRMVKIIMTGYPSLQNAMEAVNKSADAYLLKPVNMDKVLSTIDEHLKRQHGEKKYSQNKITEFIETRIKELEKEQIATKKTTR